MEAAVAVLFVHIAWRSKGERPTQILVAQLNCRLSLSGLLCSETPSMYPECLIAKYCEWQSVLASMEAPTTLGRSLVVKFGEEQMKGPPFLLQCSLLHVVHVAQAYTACNRIRLTAVGDNFGKRDAKGKERDPKDFLESQKRLILEILE